MVKKIAKGIANSAVGKMPKLISYDWKNQVNKIVVIAPKDISSPWAKFENLKTVYIIVTPNAPSANWHPYVRPGIMI